MTDDPGMRRLPDDGEAPYGSEASPITASSSLRPASGWGAPAAGDVLFWTELRPLEDGR